MKTLKRILAAVAMCLIIATSFVSCACTENFDNTGVGNVTASQSIGNGGLAVISGNYLYFANGYSSKTENYEDNKIGKQTKGAIYRVSLTGASYLVNGDNVSYNGGDYEVLTETLKDKDDNDVENKNIKDASLVVGKKVGFEYGGFYIFGDFIYYSTPSNKYNKDNSKRTNEVEFYRIRTNGKNNELITSVENYTDTSKFAFYHHNKDVYGVITSGETITITKNNKVILTKEGAGNFVLPVKTNFNLASETASGYTATDRVVTFMVGGKLWMYAIGDADFTERVDLPSGSTLIENLGTYNGIYFLHDSSVYKFSAASHQWLYTTDSTDIKMLETGVFIEKTDGTLIRRLATKNYLKELFIEEDVKIESYLNGDVYYVGSDEYENKVVKKINVYTKETSAVFVPEKNGTLKTDNIKNIFTLGSYVYYYRLNSDEFTTQGYYLERSTSSGDFIKTPMNFRTGDDNKIIEKEEE